MKLGKKSRQIIKEYTENNVKITRYAEIKPKNSYIRGKPRKPTYGPKTP